MRGGRVKIEGMVVGSVSVVPETGWLEAEFEDGAFIPRLGSLYVGSAEAAQIPVGSKVVITIEVVPDAGPDVVVPSAGPAGKAKR